MIPAPVKHSPALGPGPAGPPVWHANGGHKEARNPVSEPIGGGAAFAVDPQCLGAPHKHTQYPYVTGTSVLAIKYKDGVMMAADTLGSYGSTKRYKSVDRIKAVGENTVIGASGEISDFQYIMTLLEELMTEDFCLDDGCRLTPEEIHAYLTRVMYNRRNKFDPLWNSLIVAGVRGGKSFLGMVGMIGTAYTDSHLATGFGNHLARPIFREEQKDDMSEADARALLEKCLKVCYYRDKNSINKFTIAKVTEGGVEVSEPFALETDWGYDAFINPAIAALGSW